MARTPTPDTGASSLSPQGSVLARGGPSLRKPGDAAVAGRRESTPLAAALASGFSTEVVRWQKNHGRNSLPWQNTRDPYRVWLSEIMLQQTQVATVLDFCCVFRRWPSWL